MIILGVDSGKHKCGWAVFGPQGLYVCGYQADPPTDLGVVDLAILEIANAHDSRAGRIDPQDLIDESVGGALFLGAVKRHRTKIILPYEWKGTVPKEIMCDQIWDLLSPVEQALVNACGVPKGKRHNVLDAIGICLKEVGRL